MTHSIRFTRRPSGPGLACASRCERNRNKYRIANGFTHTRHIPQVIAYGPINCYANRVNAAVTSPVDEAGFVRCSLSMRRIVAKFRDPISMV